MLNPEKCTHKNVIKAGVYISVGRKRQRLKCKDCGRIILNGDL